METIYLSLVHTVSWGYLFHEIPSIILFDADKLDTKHSISKSNHYYFVEDCGLKKSLEEQNLQDESLTITIL